MGRNSHIIAALNTQKAGRWELRLARCFGRRRVYWDGTYHVRVSRWRGHDYLLSYES